jgi:hypothetical protein
MAHRRPKFWRPSDGDPFETFHYETWLWVFRPPRTARAARRRRIRINRWRRAASGRMQEMKRFDPNVIIFEDPGILPPRIYRDRMGQRISFARAHMLDIDVRYKVVAFTRMRRSTGTWAVVDTVWLGLSADSVFNPDPPAFESITNDGGKWGDAIRWCTEAEALAGHARMVSYVRECVDAGLPIDQEKLHDLADSLNFNALEMHPIGVTEPPAPGEPQLFGYPD